MKKLPFVLSFVITMLTVFSISIHASEMKDLELFDQIDTTSGAHSVIASPNGDMLLIQEHYTWEVYLYSKSSGIKIQLPTETRAGMALGGMSFSFDGSLAAYFSTRGAAALEPSTISVIDTRSGEILNEFHLNTSSPTLAFDRENNLIFRELIGSFPDDLKDGITIRNVYTGNTVVEIVGHASRVLCHSPVQNHLASAGWDNMIRILDSKTGGSVRTLEFSNEIVNMMYSPDGKYLVVCGSNNAVLFDAGNNYNRLHNFDRGGRVSFSNDNNMLMIGDAIYLIPNAFERPIAIRDGANDLSVGYAFISPDGQTIFNYHYSKSGVRLLDAANISAHLEEIQLDQDIITLVVGQELELNLIGIYSDGSAKPIDVNNASLTISDFTIAKINDNTRVQALSAGQTELNILYQGFSIAKAITVVSQQTAIAVTDPVHNVDASQSQTEIAVIVNGEKLSLDQPPIIVDGRTLVPLRTIFEALNADISWDESTQTVNAVREEVEIMLQINSNILLLNGEEIILDVAAQIVDGRTLVPIRAVGESLGVNIIWAPTENSVIITD